MSAFFDYDWGMRPTPTITYPPRRARPILYLALLALGWLCACAEVPPAPQLPPTQWLRVQVSPALALFNDLYATCTPSGTGLAIQQVTGGAFPADQVDLTLRWGPATEQRGYAANIGEEELAAVVHPENGMTDLDRSALKTVLSGDLPAWDWDYLGQAPQVLNLYAYPSSSEIQAILASQLLDQNPALPREVIVVPGPAEMRDAVAADPGALGFLPRRWVDGSVKIVTVNGLDSGAWTQPILALSAVEPQGPARDWLLCVQQGIQ